MKHLLATLLACACACIASQASAEAQTQPDAPPAAGAGAPRQPATPDTAALTVTWWQWAMSLPVEPWQVNHESMCVLGGQEEAWFLAGTDGIGDITRTCNVRLGVPLLAPVATRYIVRPFAPGKDEPVPDCPQLQARAAMPPQGLLRATVTLDGVDLGAIAQYRVQSDCFDPYPSLPPPEGKPAPLAAADGYWLLLEPLTPGEHVLEVDAHYRREGKGGFEIVQRYRYVLQVGVTPRYVMR